MIGALLKSKEVPFFFVEVKRPAATSKYQPEDDATKLMKLLKSSIDQQLHLGVEDPVSLGVLVEGYACTLYQMKLVAHGVYIPSAIKRFSLMEDAHQLVLLPGLVESLYYVKLEANSFAKKVLKTRAR
ncbi:hypothetical protein MBANPS3_009295 [Mucor bainieri]